MVSVNTIIANNRNLQTKAIKDNFIEPSPYNDLLNTEQLTQVNKFSSHTKYMHNPNS
jgi:hypothetical protein